MELQLEGTASSSRCPRGARDVAGELLGGRGVVERLLGGVAGCRCAGGEGEALVPSARCGGERAAGRRLRTTARGPRTRAALSAAAFAAAAADCPGVACKCCKHTHTRTHGRTRSAHGECPLSALRVPSECTRIGRTWPLAKKALTSALPLYWAAWSAGVRPPCGAGTRRTRAVGSEGRQRPKGRRAGAAHDDGAASEGACPPPSRHQ